MTDFENREKAFEKKFVHEEEVAFKANSKRNRLLGQWAAGLLDYTGEKADAYVKEVIASDFELAGDDDIVKKVLTDLGNAGVVISEKEIRVKLAEFYKTALSQVTS